MSRSTADIHKQLAKLQIAEAEGKRQQPGLNDEAAHVQMVSSSPINVVQADLGLTVQDDEKKEIERKNRVFSYAALNDHFDQTKKRLIIDQYGVMLIPRNPNFFMLTYIGENVEGCPEGSILATVGLKFHISLPEPDNEKGELSRGWEIVNSVLRAHQTDFKMIRRGVNMFNVPEQRGKIVTVYAGPEKDGKLWELIFQEMTEKLVAASVPPGFRPPGTPQKPERSLFGCNYVTYRYFDEDNRINRLEDSERGKILALLDSNRQIKEKDDPIGKLKIAVPDQMDIPKWEGIADSSISKFSPH